MPTIQLLLDFTPAPAVNTQSIPNEHAWRDITPIAQHIGVSESCLVSSTLYNELDDQALYDALWTAHFTLSLGYSNTIRFTLAQDKRFIQFKAIRTNRAVRLGCANDF